MQNLNNNHGVYACKYIIKYHAEPAFDVFVSVANWPRLDDIKQAKEDKTQQNPVKTGGCGYHGDEEAGELIYTHARMVMGIGIATNAIT